MRTLVVAIFTAVSLVPARAQTPQFHVLTAAEAAAINARRPSDWSPHHLVAGDVFVIDRDGIHIPTSAVVPSPTLYGIESGLIPTWPTAAVSGCTIVSGGSGYSSNPTAAFLGGVTHGGGAGGTITLTESGGVVNSCSVTAGGNYSYPPEVLAQGNAEISSVLGNTNNLFTSAGVILLNGVTVAVPAYSHTYTTLNAADTFCDFISGAGAITTQVAQNGTGNFGCTVPPAGSVLLRTVFVTNGQPGSNRGTMNGVTAIQYFMPMTAGFGYFDTNSVDFPPQSTELPFGNATTANFPCMMGVFGGRQGGCQFNGQFWLFESQDIQPQPFTNQLDAGPLLEFQRVNFSRAGVSGDLLFSLSSEGMNANTALIQYGQILNRVVNAGTGAHSYGDAAGAWDFYTNGLDNSYAGISVPRFTIGSGLFPPTFGGYECGQFPAPSGAVALADEGPSSINLCGNATNNFGNPAGYYLDNNIVLQTNKWTLYGSGSGSNFIASDSNGSIGFGTTSPFGSTGFAKSYVFEGDQNGQTFVVARNNTAQGSTVAGFIGSTSTTNSTFGLALHDNAGSPTLAFNGGNGTLSIPITFQFGSYTFGSPSGAQWAALSTGALTLGNAGTLAGSIIFDNATSGAITVAPPIGALGSAVLTLPDVTDTLTANAATQTLTNKSIAGSEINSGLIGASFGGTGVNNGSSTLTLGASLTTTGSNAATLAFGSSGSFTYTFPTASGTLLSTAGATFNAAPANPTGTSSTTGVMAGLGTTCTMTPNYSTRIAIQFDGAIGTNTAGDGAQATIYYGTGTAPSNGAAVTGTILSAASTYNNASNGTQLVPFSVNAIVTGLTPGTAYWFDLKQNAVTGGTASLFNISCNGFGM